MSVIQSKQNEVRFLKRKNLEEEARILGNQYSDLIRLYGIDCIYRKLNTNVFGDFKGIVDTNTILKHAYGQNDSPDYSCTALMITYPEVQTDIFQLNKFGGGIPEAEIDFNFDSKQFACDLATKFGQLKEYKIKDIDIHCEIPDDISHDKPFLLKFGYDEQFECSIMKGTLSTRIFEIDYDSELEVVCSINRGIEFRTSFLKNDDLYKSLEYNICNEDNVNSMILLTYKVKKVPIDKDLNTNEIIYKNILSGTIHGSILFYDINKIGKYIELIHPEVGDLVTIDFPDDKNRETYEITDCYDKSLQNDGISPLLHKYIWKCKARRFVDNYNDIHEHNEADERLDENIKFEQVVEEEIVNKISIYDEGDQEIYGGYEGVIDRYDKQYPDNIHNRRYDKITDGECLDIMRFDVGSRLVTNGYDLIFVDVDGNGYIVDRYDDDLIIQDACFECGLRWLKASKEQIVFVNIEGEKTVLAKNEDIIQEELQLCINDLNEKTIDSENINSNYQNFIKFKECRSFMYASKYHLFACLEAGNRIFKLI